ncbi:CYTH domain-containing protein [Lutibaculum baratangense]|nr:CYTH domain-containing protein [Lutibaculum baratangense]
MGIEIERKFLVSSEGWRGMVTESRTLRDGLIGRFGEGKVRVRVCGEEATLTVKGPRDGLRRAEYEYRIPVSDAEELLSLSIVPVLEKTRHVVRYSGTTWQVDVYAGLLGGLVLAEVELEREDQEIELPDWVGREVTGEPEYRKANLLARWPGAMTPAR